LRLISTEGRCPPTDLRTALEQGLAPDGGLYLPDHLTPIDSGALDALRGRSFAEVSRVVAEHLLGAEFEPSDLDRMIRSAFDFDVPLVEIEDGIHVLELFHGPTLAFKDIGARFMAGLYTLLDRSDAPDRTILVATSGDTGSAVAHAFLHVPSVRTFILFPKDKVSPLQERQFTTLGGNVRALEVEGTFDDCQRLVKRAFTDEDLRERACITSANSINMGRLLPQIFCYVYAWTLLPPGSTPLFSVPSGNFGNLTAGLIARKLGVPARGFVAATNVNDTVPEYLDTGVVRPRPSTSTISNAMDVGDPSNLARMLFLYGGDVNRLREDVVGSANDDARTRQCIRDVYQRTGHVLDPHSAVGYLGIRAGLDAFGEGPTVLLSTAHPVKFRQTVKAEIGVPVPVPERLEGCLSAERLVTPMRPELTDLRKLLLS